MRYISTRGHASALTFEQALLNGLAPDGGLYVPQALPHVDQATLKQWRGLSYPELALEVMLPFVGDCIPRETFKDIINASYANFTHQAVAPLQQTGTNEWVLELFHGPTLAFKDFALQLLGRLLDHSLSARQERAVIIGATSGDTGSAAIEGCCHCDSVDIFILHPYNKISEVQRRQMTTNTHDNVHNIAIAGNFDDCQALVKACFAQQEFLQGKARLVAVNSINWARIMAQIVYYFYAALALGAPDRAVSFSVPTGNFGDIFAGYLAKRMGLPIQQLCIATNENDILHRFFTDNAYHITDLKATFSPSMDIMVSSNFERLLFDLYERDGQVLARQMAQFQQTGTLSVHPEQWQQARAVFQSAKVSDATTLSVIKQVYQQTNGYVLDPHSAIGLHAARTLRQDRHTPMVTLATAHPLKFPETLAQAGLDIPPLPPFMEDLYKRPERLQTLPAQQDVLQQWIQAHARVLQR